MYVVSMESLCTDYWVPYDKYKVVAKRGDNIPRDDDAQSTSLDGTILSRTP